MNWQIKIVLPVAAVLLNSLLLFALVTSTQGNTAGSGKVVLSIAIGGAVCICAVMLMVLAVVVRQPMLELQEKIARVREGDLWVDVSFAHRNDEIGDLGRNFNEMVRQLRESREEIHRLHRTQMTRAEHLATLGELAAGLAHEIRNPLAGIAGVIEIVARDLPQNSPAQAVLGDVRHEVQHINRIVSELLEIARPRDPDFRLGDLVATTEHAVTFAREQLAARQVGLSFNKQVKLPKIEHDAGQMHQVLLNLLLNAAQACQPGGHVTLEFGQDDDNVSVAVADDGAGITAEALPHIFRPFYTTKGEGTGLGLSLARRIVEDHGGTIEVSSWPGKGSRFTVVLPRDRRRLSEDGSPLPDGPTARNAGQD